MTEPDPTLPEEAFKRPFADVLVELNRGASHGEATDKLHEVIQGIKDTGRKGTLTVVVEIEPASKSDTDVLLVSARIVAKVPKTDGKKSPFYVTAEGNLSGRDPRQLSFDTLKEVPAQPIKETKNA